MRKDRVWTLFLTALYTLFLFESITACLTLCIDVEIKGKLYLQIEYYSLLLQEGDCPNAHSDG